MGGVRVLGKPIRQWMMRLCAGILMTVLLAGSAIAEDTQDKPVWLVIGDSISEHNFHSEHNYDEYVSAMLDVDVVNVAMGGTGYLKAYKDYGPWINYVQDWPEDVDFITVMGGLNDSSFPLGEFNDENVDTLYGALREFYETLLDQYPTTPIGVITSTPRADSWGEDGRDVPIVDAILRVAHHYSLPTLDLYRCSGLRPWLDECNQAFFSNEAHPDGDGIHLNAAGQAYIAPQIAAFIRDNLMK